MTTASDAQFHEAVDRFSDMADRRLLALIGREEQVANLHDGLLYSMGLDQTDARARGKRIRPVLCLATAESLGADPEDALDFACAIELMHNFALVHDDIEDGDLVRRNRPTTWQKYGLAHGVNIGDYLFCKVWSTLLNAKGWDEMVRLKLMRLMSETLDHTHIGQSLDISARHSRNFTHTEYFRLVREKTGYYLAAPMLGAAIIGQVNDGTTRALQEFGHHLGPLFQITDDTLDLTKGKGRGGMIGSDIREGKRSFLVAEATKRASPEEREKLYDVLDAPRDQNSQEEIDWVIDLFERHKVHQKARMHCEDLLEKALDCLNRVPKDTRDTLTLFARKMLERTT